MSKFFDYAKTPPPPYAPALALEPIARFPWPYKTFSIILLSCLKRFRAADLFSCRQPGRNLRGAPRSRVLLHCPRLPGLLTLRLLLLLGPGGPRHPRRAARPLPCPRPPTLRHLPGTTAPKSRRLVHHKSRVHRCLYI